jgi:hypothetical protein
MAPVFFPGLWTCRKALRALIAYRSALFRFGCLYTGTAILNVRAVLRGYRLPADFKAALEELFLTNVDRVAAIFTSLSPTTR